VTLARPKLRGTDEAFASRRLGKHDTRTHALESVTIAGYVRGLSTRDVEASLAEALGAEAALSKSTVSRVCEAIKDEFDTRGAQPGRCRTRLPVPGRVALPVPRRRPRRTGHGRLRHHRRRRPRGCSRSRRSQPSPTTRSSGEPPRVLWRGSAVPGFGRGSVAGHQRQPLGAC
jgi:hypothetical protein